MSKLSHSNPNLDDVLHEGNKHNALSRYSAMELAKQRTACLLNEISAVSLVSLLAKAYLKGLEDAREVARP